MSIWEYCDTSTDDTSLEEVRRYIRWNVHAGKPVSVHNYGPMDYSNICIYCRSELQPLGYQLRCEVFVCAKCGWWLVAKECVEGPGYEGTQTLSACWSSLRNLDLSNVSAPLQELQAYLVAKYIDRFVIHPRKYEELVAAVFSNSGYSVRVTSYSRDRGIDVFILDGQRNDLIGIQVKRQRGKVEAEQIRSLAGALVLHGITKGIFVTTSDFRRGAQETAQSFDTKGLAIELCDAATFYDRLKLTQRPDYLTVNDPNAPFSKVLQSPDKFTFRTYCGNSW